MKAPRRFGLIPILRNSHNEISDDDGNVAAGVEITGGTKSMNGDAPDCQENALPLDLLIGSSGAENRDSYRTSVHAKLVDSPTACFSFSHTSAEYRKWYKSITAEIAKEASTNDLRRRESIARSKEELGRALEAYRRSSGECALINLQEAERGKEALADMPPKESLWVSCRRVWIFHY